MQKISGLKIFIALVILAVVGVLVTGLFIIGSPAAERARRLDNQRLNDLQQITYAVDTFYNLEKRLPTDLTELAGSRNVYLNSIKDPKTQALYEYRTTSVSAYELCANFESVTNTSTDGNYPAPMAYPIGGPGLTFWNHNIGRTCFPINVTIQPTPAVPLK